MQVRVVNENGLVVGGHRVLDASITKTSSVGNSTFVVEGKIGTGGEGPAYSLLAVLVLTRWCVDGGVMALLDRPMHGSLVRHHIAFVTCHICSCFHQDVAQPISSTCMLCSCAQSTAPSSSAASFSRSGWTPSVAVMPAHCQVRHFANGCTSAALPLPQLLAHLLGAV